MLVAAGYSPSSGVELYDIGVGGRGTVGEVEHIVQSSGCRIEGTAANTLTCEEGVLDKLRNGSLVGGGAVDVVLLGPGRDDQQGQTRTVTAAALNRLAVGVGARQSRA